jgi:hypothetical protein
MESEYSGGFVTTGRLPPLTPHIRHTRLGPPPRGTSLKRSLPKLAKRQRRWGFSTGNENEPYIGDLRGIGCMAGCLLAQIRAI